MNNLQDKILEKIEKENLQPTSVRTILFKKYTIFLTLFLSVIFTALSFSALSFIFINLDWFYYKDFEENLPFFIWRHFPFFWLIMSSIFIALSIYIWKNTDKGYKYSGILVTITLFIFTILLGNAFNFLHAGRLLDNKLADPNWRPSFEDKRMQVWDAPDKKRLIGNIIEIDNVAQTFILEDRRFFWDIKFADIEKGQDNIQVGNKVKLLCKYSEECILLKY